MFSDETIIEYQKGIQHDIWRLSESFLKEMSWWMNHQIQVHSERVQLAVTEARRYAPPRQSNPITIPTQVPEVLVAEVRETLLAAAVSGPVCEETPTQSNPITIPTQVPEVLVAEVWETLLAAAVSGPVCEETPAKRTPKRRGAIGQTISKVLNILAEDVNCILCNVLTSYELSDSEFEDLQFESSLEAGQVAGEITELMEQQKSTGNSIRMFLAKEYVKASIHCMATQTRRKFYPAAAAEESRGSLHIIVDEICEVLLTEDVEKREEGEEVCVVQKFKDTVPVRIPEITQTLVDLLFEFVTSSCSWHQFVNATWMSSEGVRSKMISDETVIEYQKGIKQDIWRLSESFLKEMSWWMNHQIQVHSERVQLAVTEASSAPPPQVKLRFSL
ncbi:hypothetical protein F7725_013774 [Dissostichus mawsoni]|uniref:Uncharacterized protein n=1 Tax=Dissostichus mawsoni TaxID=36200 RepID=A0A7J5YUE8_DISMA|nr:hypothetical protein F7725_013774 [Dissostichus mawsoni]